MSGETFAARRRGCGQGRNGRSAHFRAHFRAYFRPGGRAPEAFDLLRNVARSRGQKVIDIAGAVVDSTSSPLLPLLEELARKQLPPRKRGRSPRHARTGENVAAER